MVGRKRADAPKRKLSQLCAKRNAKPPTRAGARSASRVKPVFKLKHRSSARRRAALPLTAQRRLARRRSGPIRTARLRQLPRPATPWRGRPARALRPPKDRRASHEAEPMKLIVRTAGTTVALRPLRKISVSVRAEVAALLDTVRASVDTCGNDHA